MAGYDPTCPYCDRMDCNGEHPEEERIPRSGRSSYYNADQPADPPISRREAWASTLLTAVMTIPVFFGFHAWYYLILLVLMIGISIGMHTSVGK